MRLSLRLIVALGALLLSLPNRKPASASQRFSNGLPVSQSPGAGLNIDYQTLENGIATPITLSSPFNLIWLFVVIGFLCSRQSLHGFTSKRYCYER